MAIALTSQEVEIEKIGDTLVLRLVTKRKLTGQAEALAMFNPDAKRTSTVPADTGHSGIAI